MELVDSEQTILYVLNIEKCCRNEWWALARYCHSQGMNDVLYAIALVIVASFKNGDGSPIFIPWCITKERSCLVSSVPQLSHHLC